MLINRNIGTISGKVQGCIRLAVFPITIRQFTACFKTCRYRVAREPCHSERLVRHSSLSDGGSEESQSGGYQTRLRRSASPRRVPEIPRRYAPRNDTLGCYPVLNHAVFMIMDPIKTIEW